MHHEYHNSLVDAAAFVTPKLNSMHDDFASIPPPKDDDKWVKILLDLVGLGTLTVAAQFFNNFLRTLPYFIPRESSLNNAKDFTMGVIGTTTSIAKELLPPAKGTDWNPQAQNKFSSYLGEVLNGWSYASEKSLLRFFDVPDDAALDQLWDMIKNGQLSEGKIDDNVVRPDKPTASTIRDQITKTIFGFWYSASLALFQIIRLHS